MSWGLVAGTVVIAAGMAAAAPRATCKPRRDEEQDEIGHTSEVIVIGGGIVGAAVACFLTKTGVRDVMLLEKGSIGCEASGLSAGTLWNAGLPTTVGAEDVALYLRARSVSLLKDLGGCEFNQSGALDVAATPEEARLLRADFEQQVRQGLTVEWLGTPEEVVACEPALAGGSALCATHTPMSGSVQPALATQRFAAVAAANTCEIVEGAEVVSLGQYVNDQGIHMVRATTSDGRIYSARHAVIAGGHTSASLAYSLGVSLPVAAVKGVVCVSTAHAEAGALKKVIFDMASRLYFGEHGSGRDDASGTPAKCTHEASGARRCRKLYGKQCGPSDGHMLLFGGDRLPGVAAGDYAPPVSSIASIRGHVRELCPSLKGYGGEDGRAGQEDAHAGEWAGLMPFSRDGRPIVGSLASLGLPNCWLACGFGPVGIMEGPHAAKLLAGRVAAQVGGCGGEMKNETNETKEDKVAMESLKPSRCCERLIG